LIKKEKKNQGCTKLWKQSRLNRYILENIGTH